MELKADCEDSLSKVLPMLAAAIKALETLKKGDI